MSPRSWTATVWRYAWLLDRRTRALLGLNPRAVIDLSPELDGAERERALRLLSDGGSDGIESDGPDESESDVGADATGGPDAGSPFDVDDDYGRKQRVGLVVGPLLFAAIMLLPAPEGLSAAGKAVAASSVWIVTWWMTESLPIPATSLLPLVLFPTAAGLAPSTASKPYANDLIFLFMGGFFLAVSFRRWGLHRRIALRTIKSIGSSPKRIILGFMVATAFLSMWISNTATTVMVTPIGLAVTLQVADLVGESDLEVPTGRGEFNFGSALMLAIAYSATLGGIGTLIGTPPNIVFAGIVGDLFGRDIGFAQWMWYGLPIAAFGVLTAWLYITRVAVPSRIEEIPGGLEVVDEQLAGVGPLSTAERRVLVVFVVTALAWLVRKPVLNEFLPAVSDSTIAIGAALALFLIPAGTAEGDDSLTFLLDWTTGLEIPWGVILLFGGGLSMANAFSETGLASWIGHGLTIFEGVPMVVLLAAVVVITSAISEVASNTATATIMMPILAGLAIGLEVHPYALMIAGATAASVVFMLPVSTPPNSVVFGSGYVTVQEMFRVGLGLKLIGLLIVIALAMVWLPIAWGIEISSLPSWAV
ncbi:MAG: SLC13 family permease [Halodesulfurarchaeum sp.]